MFEDFFARMPLFTSKGNPPFSSNTCIYSFSHS